MHPKMIIQTVDDSVRCRAKSTFILLLHGVNELHVTNYVELASTEGTVTTLQLLYLGVHFFG
jgi:hypothetical protein